MENLLQTWIAGYRVFRKRYASGEEALLSSLARRGQSPQAMIVACCDARVDPALILQCDPGELFVVRNVANIVPPYERDEAHHGTSAALEFGIRVLGIQHLILLGHSQCGGIQALLRSDTEKSDFIQKWVSLIDYPWKEQNSDRVAQSALLASYRHAIGFPWIKARVAQQQLQIHCWFFDIQTGTLLTYVFSENRYVPLEEAFV